MSFDDGQSSAPSPSLPDVEGNGSPSPCVLEDLVNAPGPIQVFLDANVLIPQNLRAVFLELADAKEIRVHWSDEVLVEVRRNLVRSTAYGLDPAKVDRLLDLMAQAFPDALVQGHEAYGSRFIGKTDRKDQHVAAGALKLSLTVHGGQAVSLVTSNVVDLPQRAFEGTLVLMAHPDRFLTALLLARPGAVTGTIERLLARLNSPKLSREDFLDIMVASRCDDFAVAIGHEWGLTLDETPTPHRRPA